jgi:hypothetical protein
MTAKLDRCQVKIAGTAAVPGENGAAGTPAIPDQYYYFYSTHGVYVGDPETAGTIANVTGVVAETSETDYSSNVFTTIKELIRAGIIQTKQVIVKDTSGATVVSYHKTLHVGDDQKANFDELIEGVLWPIGKGAGQRIFDVVNRRRITSRR